MSARIALMVRRPQGGDAWGWEVFAWCDAPTLRDAYTAADTVWRTQVKGRGITAWSFAATEDEAARMLADPSFVPDGGSEL